MHNKADENLFTVTVVLTDPSHVLNPLFPSAKRLP